MTSLDYTGLSCKVVRQGGLTIALDGTQPTTGYAVALAGYERRYRVNSTRQLADAFYSYVVNNARALKDAGAHIGIWHAPDGSFCFDVTHVLTSERDAMMLAQLGDQEAIYDLSTGQEISCSPVS